MKFKKDGHYSWTIMFAAILMKIGAGALMASNGNFITPIVKDLDISATAFSSIISIEAVGMALFYTIAARCLTTKRVGIVMGIAYLAEVLGVALMSTYTKAWMFYASAAVIGVSQAFTGYVAFPILINMWFKKDAGSVLGTVIAVSGASSVAFGQISAQLIVGIGWRWAYIVLAVIGFVFTVPVAFRWIKSPSEVGCRAYGEDEMELREDGSSVSKETWGLTRSEAFQQMAFWLAWATCLCYSLGSGGSGYITSFLTLELGKSITYAARIGLFSSLGGILSSIILGKINDKYGVKAGLVYGAVCVVAGTAVLLLSFRNPLYSIPASFIIGLGSSMYSVQAPLIARSVVGDKHYSDVWSVMMVANSLIGGGLYSSWALFYDVGGSFRGTFIFSALFYVVAIFVGFTAMNLSEKYKHVQDSEIEG
ncbi:MAG: MFS transporter [Erysipelotrichaceae bacterium]|nr:MFS transporter [Erysipelotrichaceae bacterium]